MTTLAGFTLLQEQPPLGPMPLWEIVNVGFGRGTDWRLSLTLENGGQSICLAFPSVVSFRVQDEADMLEYWPVREREGVAVATVYVIDRSPYKDEFQSGSAAGLHMPLTHYLIAGDNVCVEALGGPDSTPTISPT